MGFHMGRYVFKLEYVYIYKYINVRMKGKACAMLSANYVSRTDDSYTVWGKRVLVWCFISMLFLVRQAGRVTIVMSRFCRVFEGYRAW